MQIFGIPSKVNSEYWRICWSKKIYEDEDINKSQSDDCDECVDQGEDDDDDHEEDDDANGKAMNGARTKAEWVRADTHTLFSAFNPDCDDRSWSSEPPDQSWWSFSPWIILSELRCFWGWLWIVFMQLSKHVYYSFKIKRPFPTKMILRLQVQKCAGQINEEGFSYLLKVCSSNTRSCTNGDHT